MMSDYKENWRNYYPPMIPIYFMDYEALKEMLEKNPMAVNDDGLEMMLGYFEEFEQYEKASLVRNAKWKREMFAENDYPSKERFDKKPDFPPPNDGKEWQPSEDGTHWVRKMTEDEAKKYLNNDEDKKGYNPFQ